MTNPRSRHPAAIACMLGALFGFAAPAATLYAEEDIPEGLEEIVFGEGREIEAVTVNGVRFESKRCFSDLP